MFFLLFVLIFIYAVYINIIKPGLYWKKKGIFYVNPWNRFVKVFLSKKSFFESVIDGYGEFPDRRYYGSYQFFKPSLVVRDLDLIKKITVKDFEHFPDHFTFVNEKADPILGLNLFSLKGDKWKDMRSTLSPAFTSAKMRSMYTLMQETAEDFANHFFINQNEVIELEMKNVYSRFTNDVIANCAFGIKCDSLKDETNQFYSMGTSLTVPTGKNAARGLAAAFFPKIFEFFRIPVFPNYIVEFFRNIVTETISLRERENIVRPDMIHLLMEARKGRLKHEIDSTQTDFDTGFATVEESSIGKATSKMELTDDIITAQALIFFFAGFETTSTMLTFLSYELALNPEVQTKLQQEVDENTNTGTVSYEQILKMKYLDQVVSEALRRYTPGFVLNRICGKDYKVEAVKANETDFIIEKGSVITIPVIGIHMDPKYFPEPKKFDPERFSDDNKGKIVPGSYMPFGNGPRNCIGSRFALLEAKVLLVSLMSRFDIMPVKRTCIPIKLGRSLGLSVKGGLWLGFKKRSNK